MLSSRIKEGLRSFSFRTGVLLFVTLCTALITYRVIIYYESVAAAYADTQAVIDAHAQEIEEAVTRYGVVYVRGLVREILKDPPDRRLYLAYRDEDEFMGNLPAWPAFEAARGDGQEITIPRGASRKPLRLLVKTVELKKNTDLLIGYDLYRIDLAKHSLLEDLAQNVVISLILAALLAVAIVWLINRQFMKINRTCDAVIGGSISRRVPVRGTDDQFDRLGLNINKMLDWITTLLGTVGDSTNALAHDMRTPLSFHRLELQALADDAGVPERARDKMREAVARVDSIVEMFDNILNIARAESRTGPELFETFDIADAARDTAAFYAPLFEEKDQTLEEIIPATAITYTGDAQLIKQAMINLIDNSIKYTPQGGNIRISLRQDGGTIVFEVADNGPGIEAGQREKAKERFFRLDKSRNTVGSGLGLSLVNAVAGLHQGVFTLEDNAPGLKAALRLPADRKKVAARD